MANARELTAAIAVVRKPWPTAIHQQADQRWP